MAYVVQVRRLAVLVEFSDDTAIGTLSDSEAQTAWVDVATVSVAPKTKRKTALMAGLAQAGIDLSPDLEARVLDEEGAYVWRARPPEPKGLRLT